MIVHIYLELQFYSKFQEVGDNSSIINEVRDIAHGSLWSHLWVVVVKFLGYIPVHLLGVGRDHLVHWGIAPAASCESSISGLQLSSSRPLKHRLGLDVPGGHLGEARALGPVAPRGGSVVRVGLSAVLLWVWKGTREGDGGMCPCGSTSTEVPPPRVASQKVSMETGDGGDGDGDGGDGDGGGGDGDGGGGDGDGGGGDGCGWLVKTRSRRQGCCRAGASQRISVLHPRADSARNGIGRQWWLGCEWWRRRWRWRRWSV